MFDYKKMSSIVILCVFLGSILVGCSEVGSKVPSDSTNNVSETLELLTQEEEELVEELEESVVADNMADVYEEIAIAEGYVNHWQENEGEYEASISADGVIDLTVHNALMIGVELTQIMRYPDEYVGRTIKMPGMYATSVDPNTDITYYYALVWDATNCCQIGMEFVLEEGEYPELGSNIVVEGTFHTYEEFGILYCTLLDAKLI